MCPKRAVRALSTWSPKEIPLTAKFSGISYLFSLPVALPEMQRAFTKVKKSSGLYKPPGRLELKLQAISSRTLKRPGFAKNT
jgi:hypothetical protein